MTERWLEQLAAKPPEIREEWTDTGQRLPGIALMLRNGPGRMTWAVRYRSPEDGSRRRLKIGYYPIMDLDQARAVHREKAEQLLRKIDPTVVIRDLENLPTVGETMVDFIEQCRIPRGDDDNRPRVITWKKYAYLLGVKATDSGVRADRGTYTPPGWLHMSIAAIEPKMIRRTAAAILKKHGDNAANDWQTVVSSMLTHAVRRGWIDSNPAKGLPMLGTRRVNRKVFDWKQVCALWRAAEQTDNACTRAIQLMLLTGQRPKTVIHTQWAHLGEPWWRIPVKLLKGGRGDHLVYLGSPIARDLIKRWRDSPLDDRYLFPSIHGRPFQSYSSFAPHVYKLREQTGVDDFVIKLCRATVGTLMTEARVELQHVALALDHAVPGVPAITRRHYVNSAEFRDKIQGAFTAYHEALTERLDAFS